MEYNKFTNDPQPFKGKNEETFRFNNGLNKTGRADYDFGPNHQEQDLNQSKSAMLKTVREQCLKLGINEVTAIEIANTAIDLYYNQHYPYEDAIHYAINEKMAENYLNNQDKQGPTR